MWEVAARPAERAGGVAQLRAADEELAVGEVGQAAGVVGVQVRQDNPADVAWREPETLQLGADLLVGGDPLADAEAEVRMPGREVALKRCAGLVGCMERPLGYLDLAVPAAQDARIPAPLLAPVRRADEPPPQLLASAPALAAAVSDAPVGVARSHASAFMFPTVRAPLPAREPNGHDQTTSVQMTSIHQTSAPRESPSRREEQR
jgi:hypothetical protein